MPAFFLPANRSTWLQCIVLCPRRRITQKVREVAAAEVALRLQRQLHMQPMPIPGNLKWPPKSGGARCALWPLHAPHACPSTTVSPSCVRHVRCQTYCMPAYSRSLRARASLRAYCLSGQGLASSSLLQVAPLGRMNTYVLLCCTANPPEAHNPPLPSLNLLPGVVTLPKSRTRSCLSRLSWCLYPRI
jgi:hypothetical protein